MAEQRPDSILPPPPRIPGAAKSALIAFVITMPLAIVGVYLSFYLAHGAGFAERAIAFVLYWPALIVIVLFGAVEVPELLVDAVSFVAEFLYVWGIVRLVRAIAHAVLAGRTAPR